MLDADPQTAGLSTPAWALVPELRERIRALRREVGSDETKRMVAILDRARSPAGHAHAIGTDAATDVVANGHDAARDALTTRLMEAFRGTASRACFGLLYELSHQHLLIQVASCLRRYGSRTDPRDVLQEVFFNIYRYPHRFNCERDDAFRVWSAMIVRNTVLKHLRAHGRTARNEIAVEDLSEQPAQHGSTPLGGVIDRESSKECGRVYLTYLWLYLQFYSMLSPRERLAIEMVEVQDKSYREAAARLGIKLENLKMVIFRARRKIHRSMRRVFDGLPPDCRPARDGRIAGEVVSRGRIEAEATQPGARQE